VLPWIEARDAIKAALEAKDEPVALAWAEGYRMGIADERTSEANIGIAGFNAKVEPARENPYVTTKPHQEAKDEPVAWMHVMDNTEGLKANGTGIVSITQKKKHPFGKAGVDFSKSYPVTSTPLYKKDNL
jgi:hypothetical protein